LNCGRDRAALSLPQFKGHFLIIVYVSSGLSTADKKEEAGDQGLQNQDIRHHHVFHDYISGKPV